MIFPEVECPQPGCTGRMVRCNSLGFRESWLECPVCHTKKEPDILLDIVEVVAETLRDLRSNIKNR